MAKAKKEPQKKGGTDVVTGKGFQPGNDLSAIRDRGRVFTRHINLLLKQDYLENGKPVVDPTDPEGKSFLTKAAKIAMNIVDQALAGQQWAMVWLIEKIEGKVPQKVEQTIVHYNLRNLTPDELETLARLLRKAGVVEMKPEEYVDITPKI